MEKIYDVSPKNIKKTSFFSRLFNDKGSMFVLIIVAFVGIVGLMVFGFNQISYAASETDAQLPDTFISAQGDSTMNRLIGETTTGVDGILPILGFYTDDGTPIFCIEYDITYEVQKEYTKGSEITDQGLIYLMSQLYPNKVFTDTNGNELDKNIQIWLTQSAIWSYLYEIGDINNQTFNSTPTLQPKSYNDNIKLVNSLYRQGTSGVEYVLRETRPLYEIYGINTIIANAKEYRQNPSVSLIVNKASDSISITNDNKYYQSDLVSIVGTTSSPIINKFESYSVDLSRTPQGTVLVDENGNVYDKISNMSPTAKFYVRVPVDKVSDNNKELQISVLGNFEMYGANEYISDRYQKVAHVKLRNQSISKPLTIQIDYTPDVPNTGKGIAQSMYFMGLVILLSGIGIIYANTKTEKSK